MPRAIPTKRSPVPVTAAFFHPQGSDQWYFVYLEYGRGSTTRQIYTVKMNFNDDDGTIQPIKVGKKGRWASVRPVTDSLPNLAVSASATASSVRPNYRVAFALGPGSGTRGNLQAPSTPSTGYNGNPMDGGADDDRKRLAPDESRRAARHPPHGGVFREARRQPCLQAGILAGRKRAGSRMADMMQSFSGPRTSMKRRCRPAICG